MTEIKLQRAGAGAVGGTPQIKLQRPKSDKVSFDSLFGEPPTPAMDNPLDALAYPGDLEGDVLAEAQAIREAFQAKYRGELDNFRAQDNTDYWFLVCFQTQEQKEQFLALADWPTHGIGGRRYLNGLALARTLGLDIQPVKLRRQAAKPVAKILQDEVTE